MNLDDVGDISLRDIHPYTKSFSSRKFITMDTETVKGKPYTFQAYDGQNPYFQVVTPDTVMECYLDYIEDHFEKGMIVWFFNMKFDMPIIHFADKKLFCYDSHEVERGNHNEKFVTDKTWFGDCTLKGNPYYIRDAYQFLFRSLEKSCKDLGVEIPKMPRPSWLGERPPISDTEKEYFKKYALTDVIALWDIVRWIENIHREYNVDISVSLADLCGKIFRKHYFEKDSIIKIPSNKLTIASLLSYHGGKTECYVKTPALIRNVHTYDIKSAYPYAMTKIPNFFNYDVHHISNEISIDDFFVDNMKHGIYQVSGSFQEHRCEYKPFYNHDFQYSTMLKKTWITGYELESATKYGCFQGIIHQGYVIESEPTEENHLIRYVSDFFTKKESATNQTERLWSKLALNALYGKFISRIVDNEGDENDKDDWKGGALFNPLIATLITGYVRSYVHYIEHSLNTLHTSVDGFITKSNYGEDIKGDIITGLGGLKREYSGDAIIFRRKVYVILDAAGKPLKHAAHGFFGNIDQLMELYRKGKIEPKKGIWYDVKRMTGLKESYRLRDPERIAFSFGSQKRKLNIDWNQYHEIN